MKNWTEFHIGIVYYSGLLFSLITGFTIVLYLSPIKSVLIKLVKKFETIWASGFKSTIILAGLLGAMSVSFKDCSGKYDNLLNSSQNTVLKGFEQVSTAFGYMSLLLGLWLVLFVLLRINMVKKKE
jgi:hypothetical protein